MIRLKSHTTRLWPSFGASSDLVCSRCSTEPQAGNTGRKRVLVFFIAEITDDPEALVRLEEFLKSDDARNRHWIIQTIAHRKLTKLAPLLTNVLFTDPDEACRDIAMWAIGKLRLDLHIPILAQLAERSVPPHDWRLLNTMKDFARPEFATFFSASFHHACISKGDKVIAAWASANLAIRKLSAF
jgi:hypothetical protein